MFGRSITLFSIFGFPVRVDLSWTLLAFLVMATTAAAHRAEPGAVEPAAAWALGALAAIGLSASIVWHELAHALVARRQGMRVRGITLFLLGGVSELEDEPPSARAEFWMAIVGPLSSVVLAALLGGAWLLAATRGAWPPVADLIAQLAFTNAVLAVFNLIPAFPLDGGRVFRSMLWWARGDALWATRAAGWLGVAFGVLFMAAGVFVVVRYGQPAALTWLLVGFFLVRSARMPYLALLAKARLAPQPVGRFMERPPASVPRWIPVADLLERATDDEELFTVMEEEQVVGLITPGIARRVPEDERALRTVGEISVRPFPQMFISPETPAVEALERMRHARLPRLLVVESGCVVGEVRLGRLLAFGFRPA